MERKWWALGAVALAVLAVGLDGTILVVALPTLATSLDASASDLVWFSSAYLLALAAAMLPVGLLGDRYGRKTVLLSALAVFGVASVMAASSTNPTQFIVARAIGGAAGAGIIVMALAALTVLFTEEERPRAVSIWAAVNFLALPAGPLLGGWLLTHAWWGLAFLINVPVVLVGLVVGAVMVPQSRAAERTRIDWPGIAEFTVGLVALVYGLVEAADHGWTAAITWAPVLGGLGLLGAFARRQRRLAATEGRDPLVEPSLFRSRAFTWGTVLAALTSLAMIGTLFTMPQYFQGVLGLDAIGSGLRLLPLIGGLVVGAGAAEPAARRFGARAVTALGFGLLAAGQLVGSLTSVDSGEWFVGGWMAVVGAGLGIALSVMSSAALAQLPHESSGVGSAVMQALQEIGSPLGVALLGGLAIAGYRARLQDAPTAARASVFDGTTVAHATGSSDLLAQVHVAFVHGMSNALLASAGIALLGAILAVTFFPSAARPVQEVGLERTVRAG